jgi:hypothetical protein
MSHDRRSVLSALGLALPFGLANVRPASASAPAGPPPVLRLRPFEEGVRAAFARPPAAGESADTRRVEVGHCDLLQTGVQGCHNALPFAGFAPGHLRIVRAGCEPGPAVGGVRLYASAVEVALTGCPADGPSRPLDFARLPPAPVLTAVEPTAPA